MEGGFEASGVAEGSADVVGQVAWAQSGAAEVLETAVLIASTAAVLKPGNPSITTISTLLRKAGICWFSQAVNTAFERPSMITSNRDKPV